MKITTYLNLIMIIAIAIIYATSIIIFGQNLSLFMHILSQSLIALNLFFFYLVKKNEKI